MNRIKLQALRYFVAIYEEGSISAAARKVHATQSGVSVQLRELEEHLGLVLFERISTGVRPTRAGERVYARAIRILREVGQLSQEVAALSGQLAGEVRVGIMPTFARAILAPVLTRFADEHPLVEVKVTEGYSALLTRMVLDGALDVAVVPDGDIPVGLRASYLDTDMELLASAAPLHGATGGVELATLPPLRLVLPGPGNARRAAIDQQLRNHDVQLAALLEMDSMMTTLDILRRGEGWASILPGCLCLPDLGGGVIHLAPITSPPMTVDYLLIEPATRATPAPVAEFAHGLAERIRWGCARIRTHFAQARTDKVNQ